MKAYNIVLLFLFMLCGEFANAQTQQGVAYQYNGKNTRTPLGNVTISYDANKRNTISTDDGKFCLILTSRKMGDRIGQVTVKKREMMVFNQQAVDEWSVRKEPLMLILCNANEFEKQKEKLINIGRSEARKKYDKQKAELEAQLSASLIKEAEYEAALDKAYEDLERLQKNIGEYADLFARIDESEIDTLAQQAIELFNQGDVEHAIKLFEQGNYMEKLDNAISTSQQAEQLRVIAEKAKEKATQDSLRAIQSLRAQIEAYKMNNEWGKAGELLKGLADRLNTYETYKKYASFCHSQNKFDDAEAYYKKGLCLLKSQFDGRDSLYYIELYWYAECLSDLGCLYNDFEEYKKAKEVLELSLKIRRDLTSDDFSAYYSNGLATTLINLGNFYESMHDYKKGEESYLEALSIYDKIAELYTDYDVYKQMKSLTLNNLALSYLEQGKYDESESFFNSALELRRELFDESDDDSARDLAWTLNNIGELQERRGNYEESLAFFEESYQIRKKLSLKNPDAYNPDLLLTSSNLCWAYFKNNMLDEGVRIAKEAIGVYHSLCANCPKLYSYELNNMVDLYAEQLSGTNLVDEIEQLYLSEISFWEGVHKTNPEINVKRNYIDSKKRLADHFFDKQQYDNAERYYRQIDDFFRQISPSDSLELISLFTNTLEKKANLFIEKQDMDRADSLFSIVIENRRRFVDSIPNLRIVNSYIFANSLYDYGILKFKRKHYTEAISLLNEAASIYECYKDTLPALADHLIDVKYYLCALNAETGNYIHANDEGLVVLPVYKDKFLANEDSYQMKYAILLGNMSHIAICLKDCEKGEKYALEGLEVAPTLHFIYTNLAAALLFQGKYAEAETIYRQYKDELKDSFLNDFKAFTEAGVIPKEYEVDVERIRLLLNE